MAYREQCCGIHTFLLELLPSDKFYSYIFWHIITANVCDCRLVPFSPDLKLSGLLELRLHRRSR